MSLLHRSFKAGKCKTSLKLAVARIKLLKNKREVQMKQMKKDLAHLLETGQEKTAMIRVEHLVREEKTMASYDFLDIYCELVVARLPIIESQKNCPIDLKEAVSTIVFASPRCADIPELLDARKQFTAKYGKDFITTALELRPNCGVNRTVVENLSARAPDGQTKLKILTGIAQEYSVEWDAKAFGEKELKPPEDLLNGPKVSESDSGRSAEPLGAQLPPYGQKPELSHVKIATGSSQSSQPSDHTNIRTPSMTMHTSTEPRTSGGAAEGGEFAHQSSQNVNHYNPNRQNWNMDFKDATSAAQAAAESAERASLAARAAAELSGYKIPRQHSSGSHKQYHAGVRIPDQQRSRNGRNSKQGFSDTNQDHTRRRPGHSDVEDDTEKTDVYCQNCSSEVEVQSSHFRVESVDHHRPMNEGTRRQSSDAFSTLSSEDDDVQSVSDLHKHGKDSRDCIFINTVDHDQYDERSEHTDSKKEVSRRQSRESTPSLSDDNGDASVSYLEEFGNDGRDHLFAGTAEGSTQSDTKQPTFDDYASVVFDEPNSDDESIGNKFGLYNLPPDTKFPPRFSENPDIWSKPVDSPFINESYSPSESINKISSPGQSAVPVLFDDSESEEEIVKNPISSESNEKVISSYSEKEATKPRLDSSSDESDGAMPYSSVIKETRKTEDSSYLSSESGRDLDFGRLRGGFRNKGYTRPPYRKGLSTSATHEKQETEDIKEQESASPVVRKKTITDALYDQKPHAHVRQETSSNIPRTSSKTPYDLKSNASGSSKTIFDSDSDEEVVVPHRGISTGVSLRTREPRAVSDVKGLSTPSSPQSARSSGSRRSMRTNVSVEHNPDPQLHSRFGEKPKSTTPTKHSRYSENFEQASTTNSASASGAVESLKQLEKETPSRENSLKKAGHVHPKLPDYDSFAAHFESLRSNR